MEGKRIMRLRFYIGALCLIFVLVAGVKAFMITNISFENGCVRLSWNASTNRFIVEETPVVSVWSNVAQCCGSSTGVTANVWETPISNEGSFFKIKLGLEVVEFPDSNLNSRVRYAIKAKHFPTNKIYDVELISITNLVMTGRGITDLTGLHRVTELITLYLGDNNIINVTPLNSLTNLVTLSLSYNPVADINPIAGLTGLKSFSVRGSGITNILALGNFTNLAFLDVASMNVNDWDPVYGLTNLTSLSFSGNQLSDLSPLQNLCHLTHLSLNGCEISNLEPLATMTNLLHIQLSGNQITDIGPLITNAVEGNLGSVMLMGNPLSDFALTNQVPQLEFYGVLVQLF